MALGKGGRRMAENRNEFLIQPKERQPVRLGGLGVIFRVDGQDTHGAFSVVEHPMRPKTLGAGMHTHSREDEYSYILEGEVTFQIGDQVFTAGPGSWVRKPRGIPHTFWNAGSAPALILEVISPAGFEGYFAEIGALLAAGGPPDFQKLGKIAEQYGLSMDRSSVAELSQKYGVSLEGA